jgi:AcrR family transcriptional regulator
MMVDKSKNKDRDISLRNKIVDCAAKMFEKKGIRDVTMDDISKRLSISKRTLYEIFEDKETLLLECMMKNQDKRKKEIEKVALRSSDVLEVILYAYLTSLKILHRTNLKFFQDVRTYPRVKCSN